jgi:hypothetical protein
LRIAAAAPERLYSSISTSVEDVVQAGRQAAHRAQREGVDRFGDLHLHEARDDLVPELEGVAVERDDLKRLSFGAGFVRFTMSIGSKSALEGVLIR